MPIPAEIRRRFYSRASGWPDVQKRIRSRARDCCERCGKPNKRILAVASGGRWYDLRDWNGRWRAPGSILVDLREPRERGVFVPWPDEPASEIRHVRIVLTTAHLNHKPGDDRDDNLAAWCQSCHLSYDVSKHAETRATHKDERRPLLMAALGVPFRGENAECYVNTEYS